MEPLDKRVLVLGGAGLVGRAICRQIAEEGIKSLVICSLFKEEASQFTKELQQEHPDIECHAEWGDLFVRWQMKDLSRNDILGDDGRRSIFLEDTLNPLNREILTESSVYNLLMKYRPDIVIDSMNTAGILAYQNIFGCSKEALAALGFMNAETRVSVEKLMCTQYMPQLIRHVQLTLQSMVEAKVRFYLKIGTCGTGGMGLNIPYTHSEDRPSQMLLSKSAIAGAHSLLLFLMARTPGAPIIKELKPAAAIAWKKISLSPIIKRGQPILLEDVTAGDLVALEGTLSKISGREVNYIEENGRPKQYIAPSIDTGENGLFSLGEFEAITDEGQMEFITPEEIAKCALWEIRGLNTGRDIVAALDNSILGPTYRAGYMRHGALRDLRGLVEKTGIDSVAFEILGPPRLSKLLYEGYLLCRCFSTFEKALQVPPEKISRKIEETIMSDQELRSRIVSIGIPVLMPSGKKLLRGSKIAIPADIPGMPAARFEITEDKIDKWAHDGWVDLRPQNMARWQTRFKTIMAAVSDIPKSDTSSNYTKGKHYWQDEDFAAFPIAFPKLASWIFINEDQGERMKW